MVSSRRKSTQSKVSYAEVDSDVDMQDDERQLQETKARSKRQKKGKGKQGKQKQAVEQAADAEDNTPSLEIFLGMPLDILSEICTHLDPASLIKLSRTSKRFRSLLLARSSRPIWLNARRSANLPELEGFNEINYALLLYGSTCTNCGSENKTVEVDYVLRVRHCRPCRESNLTERGSLRHLEPSLHARAAVCVPRAWTGPEGRPSLWEAYYRTEEILRASATLEDLQEEDDIVQDAWANRPRSSGTRSRPPTESGSGPPQSSVDEFVKKKKAEAAKRMREGKALAEAIERNVQLAQKRLADERAAEVSELKVELEIAEWLDAEIEWYIDNVFGPVQRGYSYGVARKHKQLAHSRSSRPADDPEAWEITHGLVETLVEEEQREEVAFMAQCAFEDRLIAQSQFVRPYHKQLLEAQSKGHDTFTFPRLNPFMLFPSVKELWEPRGVTLDDEAWEAALEDIKIDVEEYRATTRITAIKTILAATTSTPINSLSDDPTDYNEEEYNDAFFARITSQFFESGGDSVKSYPAVLAQRPWSVLQGYDDREVELGKLLDRRHTHALRAILDVLDLDEGTATMGDLNSHTFQWANHPYQSQQKRSWAASQLIDEVVRRLRLTKKKPLLELDICCAPSSKTPDALVAPPSDDSDSSDEVKLVRKGRFASTVAESEGEQDSALDSESQLDDVDGDARSGNSAKLSRLRRGGAVKVEEDEVAEEEDASLAEGVGEE